MEQAMRHHLTVRLAEDAARYRRLSERVEEILAQHAGNWEQQVLALGDLLAAMENDDARRGQDDTGLNRVETALYGVLLTETATDGVTEQRTGQKLPEFARPLHPLATLHTPTADFWRNPAVQPDF